ncbi:MAG: flagellar protein FlaG [Gammaproteobacteria bacterium]
MATNVDTIASALAKPAAKLNDAGNIASTSGEALPPRETRPAIQQVDFTRIVRQLDAFVEGTQRTLQFTEDAATGKMVMTVVNPETKEVIRQVPADELLALAQSLQSLVGQLVNAEA